MPLFHDFPAAKLPELIWRSEQAGDTWHTPLYRAAMQGRLALMMVPPGERVPVSLLDPTKHRLPLVIMLCGDPGHAGAHHGPDAYAQSMRFMRWANFIMLHGAGGTAFHFAIAAETAVVARRLLLVETDGATLPEWAAFRAKVAPQTPGLEVRPHPGDYHPRTGLPAGMVIQ